MGSIKAWLNTVDFIFWILSTIVLGMSMVVPELRITSGLYMAGWMLLAADIILNKTVGKPTLSRLRVLMFVVFGVATVLLIWTVVTEPKVFS